MFVLVVGGAGYIGSHTARALHRAGHRVRIYDNLSTGHAFLASGFELVVGDIQDPASVALAMRGIDAVMHFAAHAYVGESVVSPRKYFHNNVSSALTLLNATIDHGIRFLIFSSSCAVYGDSGNVPLSEEHVRAPINPYGMSKLFFEHALEAYEQAYGLRSGRLRYFNAAGADESGEIGELHEPETHLIPLALHAATGMGPPLRIFGFDYPTPDGTCIRDYVHVNDLAEAHVLALEHLQATERSFSVNLGQGCGYSINEVLSEIGEVTGLQVPRCYAPRRNGDPAILISDTKLAKQLLGWSAKRHLPQIIFTAWKWQQRVLQSPSALRASA